MKAVATMVAITVIVLTGLLGPAPTAAGQPGPAQAGPAQTPEAGGPLKLELTDMAPRIVTSDGPATLTVAGTVTNVGPTRVNDLVVRVQRGLPIATEGGIRDGLDGNAPTDAVQPQFQPLASSLGPGEQAPLRLTVPLQGLQEQGLALSETGVYELLVNVNGVPEGGLRARLAAMRMLLPVLSLPQGRDPARQATPRPFALLYPITERPHRVSTVPPEQTLLTDDELATSFATGGRLDGVVSALAEQAPVGSQARAATCLAVDPDLVETASQMSAGYRFLNADRTPVQGAGAEAARLWLERLRAVAQGGCVIALPYADADLVALTRGGMADQATLAIKEARTLLTELLAVRPVPDLIWPADGVLDGPTFDLTGAADGGKLVLTADAVEQGRTKRSTGVVPVAGRSPQVAVLTDPLMERAVRGPRAAPVDTGIGSAAPTSTPAGTPTALSTQDVIGVLAFRAGAADPAGEAPLVLAPPHQWTVDGTGARALLTAVDQYIGSGMLAPRNIGTVLADAPPGTARPVAYPLSAQSDEIPGDVVQRLRSAAADLVDLRSAVEPEPSIGIGPDAVFDPLRRGLMRPVSAAWRGQADLARRAAEAAFTRVSDLRATIRVVEPPSPYSLGTADAPLPLTVANGLPLAVRVRIEIASTSGLKVAPIEEQHINPFGRRQVSVNAQVTRSGQFTVDAAVRTPDGGLLGPPSRLRVLSTAYGTITVWLTASAGVLLVVLAARRILRRIRGEPGRRQLRDAKDPLPEVSTADQPTDAVPVPTPVAPLDHQPTAEPDPPAQDPPAQDREDQDKPAQDKEGQDKPAQDKEGQEPPAGVRPSPGPRRPAPTPQDRPDGSPRPAGKDPLPAAVKVPQVSLASPVHQASPIHQASSTDGPSTPEPLVGKAPAVPVAPVLRPTPTPRTNGAGRRPTPVPRERAATDPLPAAGSNRPDGPDSPSGPPRSEPPS
ncbi:DUF6049 family protein [Pseudonocardia sp. TRM90224]|uniref:DUF6049 family protein n=1 Tax=Pseudonocardia sp. TRM90224 TaxID=2812678 RepID=UPI001E3D4417|nr:DUF6049 family protein [Pseudonocardia sp. TRM90224]